MFLIICCFRPEISTGGAGENLTPTLTEPRRDAIPGSAPAAVDEELVSSFTKHSLRSSTLWL